MKSIIVSIETLRNVREAMREMGCHLDISDPFVTQIYEEVSALLTPAPGGSPATQE